jgi:hypothetical protein
VVNPDVHSNLPWQALVPVNRLIDVAFAGAALAFVGLAEGLSAARCFAVKGGYRWRQVRWIGADATVSQSLRQSGLGHAFGPTR